MTARKLTGTMSTFGGPEDTGVDPDEGLALCEPNEMVMFPDSMFLDEQPAGTTGLARRLNPDALYVAARWDYDTTPRSWLQDTVVIVTNPATGKSAGARPIDWGPHEDTGRICDLSPGLADLLGLTTDDVCELRIPPVPVMPTERFDHIVISSGHGLYVRGASGVIDEVDEARRTVESIADALRRRKVEVTVFHDNESTTQSENLERIVDFHNAQNRDLDVSIHFNAYEPTDKAMGTECLYVTQSALANQVSSAIAACGFVNRGAKKRTDLYFLNNTTMPSILIEVCFVDSTADAKLYEAEFATICRHVATVIAGTTVKARKQ